MAASLFEQVLDQLQAHIPQLTRVAPRHHGMILWKARLGRLWKAYLRAMSAIAGIMGTVFLTLQYFILLPPFAFFAKRAARKEPAGWVEIPRKVERSLTSQY